MHSDKNNPNSQDVRELLGEIQQHGYSDRLRAALSSPEETPDYTPTWPSGAPTQRFVYNGDEGLPDVVYDPREQDLYLAGDVDAPDTATMTLGTSFQTLKDALVEKGFYGEAEVAADLEEPWVTMIFFLEKDDYSHIQAIVEDSGLFESPDYSDGVQYERPGFTLDFYEEKPVDEREQNLVQVDMMPTKSEVYDLEAMIEAVDFLFDFSEIERLTIQADIISRRMSASSDGFVDLEDMR